MREDYVWLSAPVFAACVLGPGVALGWLLFVAPHIAPEDPRGEENVERRWQEPAASGRSSTFSAPAGWPWRSPPSVFSLDFFAMTILLCVVVGSMLDVSVRCWVAMRRTA